MSKEDTILYRAGEKVRLKSPRYYHTHKEAIGVPSKMKTNIQEALSTDGYLTVRNPVDKRDSAMCVNGWWVSVKDVVSLNTNIVVVKGVYNNG